MAAVDAEVATASTPAELARGIAEGELLPVDAAEEIAQEIVQETVRCHTRLEERRSWDTTLPTAPESTAGCKWPAAQAWTSQIECFHQDLERR